MNKPKFTILDDFNFSSNNQINQNLPDNLSSFNPKDHIRKEISNIFKDFIMTKTNQFDSFGVYKARVDCLLCVGGSRYIVAIVPNDQSILGTKIGLEKLNWTVFQTRYTDKLEELKMISIPPMNYQVPNKTSLRDKITKFLELKEKSVYKPDNLPLTIELLHLRESDVFAEKGTVLSALELFQTILILND